MKPFGVLQYSWTCGLKSFVILGKFSGTFSSNIALTLWDCTRFLSLWDCNYMYQSHLTLSQQFLMLCSFFLFFKISISFLSPLCASWVVSIDLECRHSQTFYGLTDSLPSRLISKILVELSQLRSSDQPGEDILSITTWGSLFLVISAFVVSIFLLKFSTCLCMLSTFSAIASTY